MNDLSQKRTLDNNADQYWKQNSGSNNVGKASAAHAAEARFCTKDARTEHNEMEYRARRFCGSHSGSSTGSTRQSQSSLERHQPYHCRRRQFAEALHSRPPTGRIRSYCDYARISALLESPVDRPHVEVSVVWLSFSHRLLLTIARCLALCAFCFPFLQQTHENLPQVLGRWHEGSRVEAVWPHHSQARLFPVS